MEGTEGEMDSQRVGERTKGSRSLFKLGGERKGMGLSAGVRAVRPRRGAARTRDPRVAASRRVSAAPHAPRLARLGALTLFRYAEMPRPLDRFCSMFVSQRQPAACTLQLLL